MKKTRLPGIKRAACRLACLTSLLAGPAYSASQHLGLDAVTKVGYKGNTENSGVQVQYHNAFGDNDKSAFFMDARAASLDGVDLSLGAGYRVAAESGDIFGIHGFFDSYTGASDQDDVTQFGAGAEWFPAEWVRLHANAYFSSRHTGFDAHARCAAWRNKDNTKELDLGIAAYSFKHAEDCFEGANAFSIDAKVSGPLGKNSGWGWAAKIGYFNDKNEAGERTHSSVNQWSNMRAEADVTHGVGKFLSDYRQVERTRLHDIKFAEKECDIAQIVTKYVTVGRGGDDPSDPDPAPTPEPGPTIPVTTIPEIDPVTPPTTPPTTPPVDCPDDDEDCNHLGFISGGIFQ